MNTGQHYILEKQQPMASITPASISGDASIRTASIPKSQILNKSKRNP